MSYTLAIILINFIVFILQSIAPFIIEAWWLDPSRVLNEPWILITSMFLHGGIMHILLNMYALFSFGPIVEKKMGGKDFIILYFLSGIAGNLFYYISWLIGIIPSIPALGASGAIFGVLGAAAVLFPYIRLFILPFPFPLSLKNAVIVWVLISLLETFDIAGGIAGAAHLGGLLFGYFYTKRWQEDLRRRYYQWWLE